MAKSSHMFKNTYGDETIYITSSGDYDYSQEIWRGGDKTILVNVAMADGKYIRLPEATTSNGGMHIRVVIGLAPADNLHVGFVTSLLVGGAVGLSDASQGVSAGWSQVSVVGTSNLRMTLDLDGATADGSGNAGSVIDFYYPGVANVVIVHATLIGDVDSATGANTFSTTAVNA